MNTPKYTFLLPAYKGRFLREMLDSIQGQTYTNFKVLISDDCSPEDLYSICKPYLDDPRFEYRRNESNIGSENLVNHWNMLVDMCETEYLVMASDDDVYYNNYLSEIDELTIEYPQVDLIRGRLQRINDSGQPISDSLMAGRFMNQIDFVNHYFHDIHSLQNHCYKTVPLKKMGGFIFFPHAWYSDDATNISIANNGCAVTQSVVFGFRCSELSISSNCKSSVVEQKIIATLSYDEWLRHYLSTAFGDRMPYNEDMLTQIYNIHANRTSGMLNDLLVCLDAKRFVKNMIRVARKHYTNPLLISYRYIMTNK